MLVLKVYAVDITIEWALFIRDKMAKKLLFDEVNFSIKEEIEIISIKRFDVESYTKGYRAYMDECTPEIGETLRLV